MSARVQRKFNKKVVIKKQLKSQLLRLLFLPYFLMRFLARVTEVRSTVPKETKKRREHGISGLFTEFCRITKWKTRMAQSPFLHLLERVWWPRVACIAYLDDCRFLHRLRKNSVLLKGKCLSTWVLLQGYLELSNTNIVTGLKSKDLCCSVKGAGGYVSCILWVSNELVTITTFEERFILLCRSSSKDRKYNIALLVQMHPNEVDF